ncbi:MAG: TonB-dependent receptor [Candidatus Omnitrophota bacterium]
MRKKNSRYLLTLISLAMLCFLPPEAAAQVEEYISPEALLFQEVPIVYASSKRPQRVTEASATVVTISAAEIKQSGAVTIADALRMVSGVVVWEGRPGSHDVGIRGSPYLSQNVLVTLDGNDIFIYHGNHVFWDSLPIALADIDHIEILKGPGSVFYGSSSLSGVINIVTREPKDIDGTQINVIMGEDSTQGYTLMHGGSYENWDYKFFGGINEAGRWGMSGVKDNDKDMYGTKLIYNIDDESKIAIMSYYADMDGCMFGGADPESRYTSLRYNAPDFWVRLFHHHHYKPVNLLGASAVFEDNNYEAEIVRMLRWGNNTTSLGGYAKKTRLTTDSRTSNHHLPDKAKDWALNAENEYRASEELIFTIGGRYENHTDAGGLSLGRASIIYTPVEKHIFRTTIATGYYIPAILEYTSEASWMAKAGIEDLDEENITSYELDYYGTLSDTLKTTVSLYYNEYTDMLAWIFPYSHATWFDAKQWGTEIGFDFMLTDWLSGFANYSYSFTDRNDAIDTMKYEHPRHMFNLGLRANLTETLAANLNLYRVSSSNTAVFANLPFTPWTNLIPLDAYTSVDLRLAYTSMRDVEIAIAVRNLFDEKHLEGWFVGMPADEIGRRITGTATFKF